MAIAGPDKEKAFPLPDQGSVEVGRNKTAGIQLEDVRVSRSHCAVDVRKDKIMVTDSGSRAGTFVNDQQITERELKPNDVIRIGDTELRLEVSDVSGLETVVGGDEELERVRRQVLGGQANKGTIAVTCQCGEILRAREQYAGTQVPCPNCGANLRLPDKPAGGEESPPRAGESSRFPPNPPGGTLDTPSHPPLPPWSGPKRLKLSKATALLIAAVLFLVLVVGSILLIWALRPSG